MDNQLFINEQIANKITLKMYFSYRRESASYTPLSYTFVFLNIEYDKIENIRFNDCRKAIKSYIAEWVGDGEILIDDAELTAYLAEKNIKKINAQLKNNMVGRTYKFNRI